MTREEEERRWRAWANVLAYLRAEPKRRENVGLERRRARARALGAIPKKPKRPKGKWGFLEKRPPLRARIVTS